MKEIEFLAIGDIVSDAFIDLIDAQVHCNINNEDCTISMKFGDKIPYRDVIELPAVGNSPNASVAAARLGTGSALIANIGDDHHGQDCIKKLQSEHIDTELITEHAGIKTNYHYVLRYGPERTILVKHEHYPYSFPKPSYTPKWVYLSSLGEGTEDYHNAIMDWLTEHPEINLAFQPGTFQMRAGLEKMKRVYARSNAFFCNKDESRRILNLPTADYPELHAKMRELGPEIVCITDGPNGATISNTEHGWFVPMYPDPQPPVERTGAGDATSSTTVCAIMMGHDLPTALSWGVINSMNVVQYVGAQEGLLSQEKIQEFLKNAPDSFQVKELW